MMARPPQPVSQLRSYGRYSLEGSEAVMANRSDIIGSRNPRPSDNHSGTIKLMRVNLPPRESSRGARNLNEKDSLYLQMIDEKNRVKTGRSNGYEMGNSHLSENAENQRQVQPKRGDSLTREIQEFDAHRR